MVNLSGCPTTSKPRLVTVKTFAAAETTFKGKLIDEILNWLPTVTDSPVPRVALENVHSVAAVHAASVPILKVPAAKGAHANPPTLASCATVPANQPLHPPMESVLPEPAVNKSGVPAVSVPKTELVVPAETIWVFMSIAVIE